MYWRALSKDGVKRVEPLRGSERFLDSLSRIPFAKLGNPTTNEVKKNKTSKRCPKQSRKNKQGECVPHGQMTKGSQVKSVFQLTIRKTPHGPSFVFDGNHYWEERTMMENLSEKEGISFLDVEFQHDDETKESAYFIVFRPRKGWSVPQLRQKVAPFLHKQFLVHYMNYKTGKIVQEDVYVDIHPR